MLPQGLGREHHHRGGAGRRGNPHPPVPARDRTRVARLCLAIAVWGVMLVIGSLIYICRSILTLKSDLPWKEKLKKLGYRPESKSFSRRISPGRDSPPRRLNQALILAIARAKSWMRDLRGGKYADTMDIARQSQLSDAGSAASCPKGDHCSGWLMFAGFYGSAI